MKLLGTQPCEGKNQLEQFVVQRQHSRRNLTRGLLKGTTNKAGLENPKLIEHSTQELNNMVQTQSDD